MKRNIKFHKMGTSNESQLKKLKRFKGVESFWYEKYGSTIYLYNEKTNEHFESFNKNTFFQFILIWRSFGILEQTNTNYVFLTKEISLDNITENILTPDNDLKIQIYRDSRIICFLIHINYINNKNIHLFNLRRIHSKKIKIKYSKISKNLMEKFLDGKKKLQKTQKNYMQLLKG